MAPSDGRAEFDPKEIARAAFPTAFRGYDQEAVRQYLKRLAAAVGRAQQLGLLGSIDHDEDTAHIRAAEAEREAAELQARVDELEELLRTSSFDVDVDDDVVEVDAVDGDDIVEVDEDDGDLVDEGEDLDEDGFALGHSPGADDDLDDDLDPEAEHADEREARTFDEAELIELLGAETAKILEAARSAGADIVQRADDEAALIKNETALKTRAAREEADEVVDEAKAEATGILASAEEEAAKSEARIRADAERLGQEAAARAEELFAEASTRAEGDLAAARQRATQIVADAENLRDEILTDLVQRRRANRGHLERLTAARDRLAEALAAARTGLDEVGHEIDLVVDPGVEIEMDADASTDADHARPPADSGGQGGGAADGGGGSGGTADEVAALVAQLSNESGGNGAPPAGEPVAGGSRANATANGAASDVATEAVGNGVLVADMAADDDVDLDALAADGVTTFDLSRDPQQVNGADPTGEFPVGEVVEEHDLADADVFVVAEADAPASALDGPIDGDRLLDQLGFAPDAVLGSGSMARTATRGDLPRSGAYPGELPVAFEARDLALTRSTAGFRRRLKRAVNDDQSDVLDRLRAGRREIQPEELPPLDEQLQGYVVALTPALRDVVAAGGELLGADSIPEPAVDNLCLQLAKHIVDNLRLPTIDAIEVAQDADREAILDPVRAIYRDFRNGLLPDLIEDALHEAFALGVFHAVDREQPILWVTDPRLDPDPICEENSASPALTKGSDFPSGHVRPLSMPGCRCLALPAV